MMGGGGKGRGRGRRREEGRRGGQEMREGRQQRDACEKLTGSGGVCKDAQEKLTLMKHITNTTCLAGAAMIHGPVKQHG